MLLKPPLKIEVVEESSGRWGARGLFSTDHGPIHLSVSAPAALLNDWQARYPKFGASGPPPVATATAPWAAWELLAEAQDVGRTQLPELAWRAGYPLPHLQQAYQLRALAQLGDRAAFGALAELGLAAALHPGAWLAWHAAQLAALALPDPEVVTPAPARLGGLSLGDVLRWGTPQEAALVAQPEVMRALMGSSPAAALHQYRPDVVASWGGC